MDPVYHSSFISIRQPALPASRYQRIGKAAAGIHRTYAYLPLVRMFTTKRTDGTTFSTTPSFTAPYCTLANRRTDGGANETHSVARCNTVRRMLGTAILRDVCVLTVRHLRLATPRYTRSPGLQPLKDRVLPVAHVKRHIGLLPHHAPVMYRTAQQQAQQVQGIIGQHERRQPAPGHHWAVGA